MTTRATAKPLRRIVSGGSQGEFVAEIRDDTVTLRPVRTRIGGDAEVHLRWSLVYQLALLRREDG